MAIEEDDCIFLGLQMSFFMFGVYTVIFGLYVKLVKNRTSSSLTKMDWTIGFLYALTGVTVILDAIQEFQHLRRGRKPETHKWLNALNSTTSVTIVVQDFVAQLVLIYRCWIVWNRNIFVAAPPLVIAAGSAASGLAVSLSYAMHPGDNKSLSWWVYAGASWQILSLIVNTLVSGLMIYKIYRIHRSTKGLLLSPGRLDLTWVASMLIESAFILFVAQLVFVVLYSIDHPAYLIIYLPVANLYGMACTFIMVSVSERRYSDSSTIRDTVSGPTSVVVLSTRSHHGGKPTNGSVSETSSGAPGGMKSPRNIEVGIEMETVYSPREPKHHDWN